MKFTKKAFTLLELVTTLTIMTIVTAISVPSISAYIKKTQYNNCKNQMESVYEEIIEASNAQRFNDFTRYNETLWRTISNHIEGEKVYDTSTLSDEEENKHVYDYLLTSSNESQQVIAENVCPNGGTLNINWDATKGSDTYVRIIKINMSCTHDSCTIEKEYQITLKQPSDPENVYTIMKGSAVSIYNEVQTYVTNNMMNASSDEWYKFISDAVGLLGGNKNLTSHFVNGNNAFGQSKLFSLSASEYRNTQIIKDSNLCSEYDTIFAMTVNPDTGVLEYFVYYSVYDNTLYRDVVTGFYYYANFVIIKNESGTPKVMTSSDVETVASDYEMKVNKAGTITNPNKWGTIYKEPPYQGNLGSWFTKISMSMNNNWIDYFDTTFSNGIIASKANNLPSPTGGDGETVSFKSGMVARIGDDNSTGHRRALYRNKTWYIQDSAKNNLNKEDYNVKLLNNVSSKEFKPVSYLTGISIKENGSLPEDLTKIKLTTTYADGDSKTVSYSNKLYLKNSTVSGAGNSGINGFYFVDTLPESATAAYKVGVNPNYDSSSVLDKFYSGEIDTIYLCYAEKGIDPSTIDVEPSIYPCYFKYITIKQTSKSIESVSITYDNYNAKKDNYYTRSNLNCSATYTISIKCYDENDYVIQDSSGNDLSLTFKKSVKKLSWGTYKLQLMYENTNYVRVNNEIAEDEDAEEVLYSGGTYYLAAVIDTVSGISEKPYLFATTDIPAYCYIKDNSGYVQILSYSPMKISTNAMNDWGMNNNPSNFKGWHDKYYIGDNIQFVEDTELEKEFYTVDENDKNTIDITIPSTVYGYWEYVGTYNDYITKQDNYKLSCRPFKVRTSNSDYQVIYFHFVAKGTMEVSTVGVTTNINSKKFQNKSIALPSGFNYNITISSGITTIANFALSDATTLPSYTYKADYNEETKQRESTYINDGETGHILSVEFEDDSNLTTIGAYSFWGCTKLKSISLPSSVLNFGVSSTNLSEYGGNVFERCYSLESVTFNNEYSITRVPVYSFAYCSNIKNVYLPDSVIQIDNYAFYNCENLQEFDIPYELTIIQANAFENCQKMYTSMTNGLRNLELHENIVKIGNNAFKGCDFDGLLEIGNGFTKISKDDGADYNKFGVNKIFGISEGQLTFTSVQIGNDVDITNEKYAQATISGSAFINCVNLKSVVVANTFSSIGSNVFKSCLNLKSAELPDTITVISSYLFYSCENLKDFELQYSVTEIKDYAFNNCKSLDQITFPDELLYIRSNAFENCISLYTSKTDGLRNLDFSDSIINIGNNAFKGCDFDGLLVIGNGFKNITQTSNVGKDSYFSVNQVFGITAGQLTFTSVRIGNSVEENSDSYAKTTISGSAFANSVNLKSVIISNAVTSTGTSVFSGCTSLEMAILPDTLTSIESSTFKNCTSLKSIDIPETTTIIKNYAFYNSGLVEIEIPDSVTTIEKNTFENCVSLTTATLSNNLETIEEALFKGCSSLGEISFPDSVKYIKNSAFENCFSLYTSKVGESRNLTLGDNIINIKDNAFKNCNFNGQLAIGNGFTIVCLSDNVEENKFSINKVFGISTGQLTFTSVRIGNTVEENSDSYAKTTISGSAFANSVNLKSVIISNAVTSTGTSVFSGCTSLEMVVIPDTFTTISNSMFNNCTSLYDIAIPDTIETMENSAFKNCTSISSFVFPKNLKNIGKNTFENCTSLYTSKTDDNRNLDFSDNIINIGENAFKGCSFDGLLVIGNGFTNITQGSKVGEDSYFSVNKIFGVSEGQLTFTSLQIGHTVSDDDSAYSTITIGNKAFYKCTKLETLTITNAVESIGTFENNSGETGAFQGCSGLEGDLIIPDGVKLIGSKSFRHTNDIGTNAAYQKGGTYKLYIPNTVERICRGAFESCTGFETLEFEDGNSDTKLKIYAYAFKNCTNLKGTLILPERVESLSLFKDSTYTQTDKGMHFAATNFDTIVFNNDINIDLSGNNSSMNGLFTSSGNDRNDTNTSINKIYYKSGTNVETVIKNLTNTVLCIDVDKVEFISYKDGETPWLDGLDDVDNVDDIETSESTD